LEETNKHMEIYLNNKQDKISLDIDYWENFVCQIGSRLKFEPNTEISITFVNNREIRKFNKKYRKIDKPTDVLSFPFDNSFNLPVKVLGDVIISTEKAELQAEEYGHSLNREIAFLMVHGILHLLGYDHETPEQEKEMFSLQKELLHGIKL
jgi:probable rRNA maturation factor